MSTPAQTAAARKPAVSHFPAVVCQAQPVPEHLGAGLCFAENAALSRHAWTTQPGAHGENLGSVSQSVCRVINEAERRGCTLEQYCFQSEARRRAKITLAEQQRPVSPLRTSMLRDILREEKEVALSLRGNVRERFARGGNVYLARLDVTRNELLDWGKPLSQQPREVQAVLRALSPEFFIPAWMDGQSVCAPGTVKDPATARQRGLQRKVPCDVVTAGEWYAAYAAKLGGSKPADYQTTSKRLAIGGVQGIRREEAGGATLVVFKPERVQITMHNGQPIKPSNAPQQLEEWRQGGAKAVVSQAPIPVPARLPSYLQPSARQQTRSSLAQ